MSSSLRILRMGWEEALRLIMEEGYRLSKFEDGHAEIISPTRTAVCAGLHLCRLESREGGCAEGYLTAGSVEILELAMSSSGEEFER